MNAPNPSGNAILGALWPRETRVVVSTDRTKDREFSAVREFFLPNGADHTILRIVTTGTAGGLAGDPGPLHAISAQRATRAISA